jgi:hypothetical protein
VGVCCTVVYTLHILRMTDLCVCVCVCVLMVLSCKE